MTIPVERTRTVLRTREFLKNLLDPKQTPRIPRALRNQARALLKHYPTAIDLEPRRIKTSFGGSEEKF